MNYLNTFLLLLLVLANYSNLYLTHFKKEDNNFKVDVYLKYFILKT